MTRRAVLALLLLGSAAQADPAPLTSTQEKLLAKRGYTAPVVVFESAALRIVTASKRAKPRLVVVTAADKIVDRGPVGAGKLSVTTPAVQGMVPGVTLLELAYHEAHADGASNTQATLWAVRDSGAIACEVSGGSSRSIGNACGSSGWTTANAKLAPAPFDAVTLEVRYDLSGHWSESDGKGGCLNRSPVRHSYVNHWTIPARGTCKKAPKPAPTP